MAACAVGRSTPSISNRIFPGRITATHWSGAPLPLPMRVSAGFLVIGLSGNSRIHTFPPRLMERVMATRAASISPSVIHAHSIALRPKSPKEMVDPRHALPAMRPRCCFLYLTFFGIIMAVFPQSLLVLAGRFRLAAGGRFLLGLRLGLRLGFRRRFLPGFLLPGGLLRRHQRRQNGRGGTQPRARQGRRARLGSEQRCAR